jgi:hypothetical protein
MGGAIFNHLGILAVESSRLTANSASGGSGANPGGGYGGAIVNLNGFVILTGTSFSGNTAAAGGAARAKAAPCTICRTTAGTPRRARRHVRR